MKYKHITPEQRYTINVLLQQNKSRKEICETIKISQSSLCRELKKTIARWQSCTPGDRIKFKNANF
ncbi:MAG: helix-turn-helix domain-containing protein [Muribaculaceae bacterium]